MSNAGNSHHQWWRRVSTGLVIAAAVAWFGISAHRVVAVQDDPAWLEKITVDLASDPDDGVRPGQQVTFTIQVGNGASTAIPDVQIKATYDSVALKDAEILAGIGGQPPDEVGVLLWNLTELPQGETTLSFRATTVPEVVMRNPFETTAFVLVDGIQVAEDSVTLRSSFTLEVDTVVDSESDPLLTLVTHRLSYSANAAFGKVVVRDAIEMIGARVLDQLTVSTDDLAGTPDRDGVTWSLENLAQGAQGVLTATFVFPDAINTGTFTVGNRITAREAELSLLVIEGSFDIATPLLSIAYVGVKPTGDDDTIEAGDGVRVIFLLTNSGDVEATSVDVIEVPDSLLQTFENISDNGALQPDGTIRWPPVSVPVGSKGMTFSYDAVVVSEIEDEQVAHHFVDARVAGLRVTEAIKEYPVVPSVSRDGEPRLSGELSFVLTLLYLLFGFGAVFWLTRQHEVSTKAGEALIVMALIAALLILALGTTVGEQAAIGLLSAIAGFALGRQLPLGKDGKGDKAKIAEVPQPPKPSPASYVVFGLGLLALIVGFIWLLDELGVAELSRNVYFSAILLAGKRQVVG